ncbi:hypothetical protein HN587_06165 [Candidatus Woesearchaeota archaeon]|jgi:hypothetical protein|nr:hypothetical protein [Candidatus Woesearchaeota archaeon]
MVFESKKKKYHNFDSHKNNKGNKNKTTSSKEVSDNSQPSFNSFEEVSFTQLNLAKNLTYILDDLVQVFSKEELRKEVNILVVKKDVINHLSDFKTALESEKNILISHNCKPSFLSVGGVSLRKINRILNVHLPKLDLIFHTHAFRDLNQLKKAAQIMHTITFICIQKEKDLSVKRKFISFKLMFKRLLLKIIR